jgi:hypothetical protein
VLHQAVRLPGCGKRPRRSARRPAPTSTHVELVLRPVLRRGLRADDPSARKRLWVPLFPVAAASATRVLMGVTVRSGA